MDRLTALYEAFRRRDVDALRAQCAPGVDWPDAMAGGRVVGRDAVGAHWRQQWEVLDLDLHPRLMRELPDGRVAVLVDQVVRDHDGDLLSEAVVLHTYTLDPDGRVERMDVGDPQV
ncbi:nuclear transport factor 2 family protein [Modestobacter sp. NPDC049651]|uniref:nuclear transport factor 2 family protein n=1 Tax=unclassified Modestobacter TaxID=2643866 RepID=UPI0033E752D7